MKFTNSQVAKMLRDVAAVYSVKGVVIFQIRAYETAADAIEHATSEIVDLWEEGSLDSVPGIGENLRAYLDELFQTGKVEHWEDVKKDFSPGFFEFLDIPGVGPKTAYRLSQAGVKDTKDLVYKLESGLLLSRGFSEKQVSKMLSGISELSVINSGRMLLPYAYSQAQKIIEYLKQSPVVKEANVLGSLRRKVATIGDLDFSVSSDDPDRVIEHIQKMPNLSLIVEKGESKVVVALSSGVHLDFLIAKPESYGALLQHFTGSKHHNIHLRTIATDKGFSLSEYGIKDIQTGKIHQTPTEKEFYTLLGMDTPSPEIREDAGEIEAALKHALPELVELKDIKGDLHLHSNLPFSSAHDSGANSVEQIILVAKSLGYEYVGIADHSPSQSGNSKEDMVRILKERSKMIEQKNYSSNKIRVLKLLEVDILPDGSLSVPDEALASLDFALAGVHSVHRQTKEQMTQRILKALSNPYVKVLTHPTGRLLNQRDSYDADWDLIFDYAAKHHKAMEINSFPDRLDLPDSLVRKAGQMGVKFVIDTDSHEVSQMVNMEFGVTVARRGWATKEEIINAWDWTRIAKWFNIK